MRTGSSFSTQAARPTELALSDLVGGSVGLRTSRTMSSSVVCSRPFPASSYMSERDGRLCEGWHGKKSGSGTNGRSIET